MSQSTLQLAPGTLQNVPKRPRVSDWVFADGLQEIWDVSGKALQRTQMPKCLHMARRSRASHSSMLPPVLVKLIPITSIANGVTVAILSIATLSATTIQNISSARGNLRHPADDLQSSSQLALNASLYMTGLPTPAAPE